MIIVVLISMKIYSLWWKKEMIMFILLIYSKKNLLISQMEFNYYPIKIMSAQKKQKWQQKEKKHIQC